jgi:hypothetical protein
VSVRATAALNCSVPTARSTSPRAVRIGSRLERDSDGDVARALGEQRRRAVEDLRAPPLRQRVLTHRAPGRRDGAVDVGRVELRNAAEQVVAVGRAHLERGGAEHGLAVDDDGGDGVRVDAGDH